MIETFTCSCGEHIYPLWTDEDDPSTWCECGLRIAQERDHAQDAARLVAQVLSPPERVPPLTGMVYQTVPNMDTYEARSGRYNTTDLDAASVTTSMVAPGPEVGAVERDPDRVHKIVLDLDLPAQLLASSTPGHFHLYIDHEVTWDRYQVLLAALASAGIIDHGYFRASIDRGYTAVRLPWVKKEEGDE